MKSYSAGPKFATRLSPLPQVSSTRALPIKSCWLVARLRNDESGNLAGSACAPAAMRSTRAVLPEPRAPITATNPLLSGIVGFLSQGVPIGRMVSRTSEGAGRAGASSPMATRTPGSMTVWRKVSKVRSPLIQQYRFSFGRPTSTTLWASQPCRQGLRPWYFFSISSRNSPLTPPSQKTRSDGFPLKMMWAIRCSSSRVAS